MVVVLRTMNLMWLKNSTETKNNTIKQMMAATPAIISCVNQRLEYYESYINNKYIICIIERIPNSL